jgi:molybdopterin synthase sulfur carrier subunit
VIAMPLVDVPPPYRGPTGGQDRIQVDGTTVGDCLEAVGERFVGFREQIFDARGEVHRFVTLFVNGDEIERNALATPVSDTDEVGILAAIAGG